MKIISFDLSLDCAPYRFVSEEGSGLWICEDFTALDLTVKSRFTERYRGKWMERENDDDPIFIYVNHDENNKLSIEFGYDIPENEQIDLIEEFFSCYYDSLDSIGYETLEGEN